MGNSRSGNESGRLETRAYADAKRLGLPEGLIAALFEAWFERRIDKVSARPTERDVLHADFLAYAVSRKGLPDGAADALRQLGPATTRMLLGAEHDLRRSNGKLYYGRVGLKPGLPAPVSIAPIDGLSVLIASQRSIVASLAAALDEARTVLASLETAQADISPDEK